MVQTKFSILILDRNRHVRMFLKRELEGKNYRVKIAENSAELKKLSTQMELFDCVILDPELSDSEGVSIVDTVLDSFPGVPIILHTFWGDKDYCSSHPSIVDCVEKNGTSIEAIQAIILERICQKNSPLSTEFITGSKPG